MSDNEEIKDEQNEELTEAENNGTQEPGSMIDIAQELLPVSLEAEMKRAYLDYAMSVIVGRALPDVRDGLKPVHRRVLFAMQQMGNVYSRPTKKSARVVGDVIGTTRMATVLPITQSCVWLSLSRFAIRWFTVKVTSVASTATVLRLCVTPK